MSVLLEFGLSFISRDASLAVVFEEAVSLVLDLEICKLDTEGRARYLI